MRLFKTSSRVGKSLTRDYEFLAQREEIDKFLLDKFLRGDKYENRARWKKRERVTFKDL